jgi:uncharacterized protein YcfL
MSETYDTRKTRITSNLCNCKSMEKRKLPKLRPLATGSCSVSAAASRQRQTLPAHYHYYYYDSKRLLVQGQTRCIDSYDRVCITAHQNLGILVDTARSEQSGSTRMRNPVTITLRFTT